MFFEMDSAAASFCFTKVFVFFGHRRPGPVQSGSCSRQCCGSLLHTRCLRLSIGVTQRPGPGAGEASLR